MASQAELDNCYMQTALAHATLSKARRAKVGCCIVTPQFTLLCGYNGTPIGYDNNCEKENEDGTLVTHSHVIHAEANAVAAAARTGVSLVGACAYVTLCPCVSCSVLMRQVGITRVVYKDAYRDNSGILMLNQLGVKVEQYDTRLQTNHYS